VKRVLTASEMRDVDRLTVEQTGIPSLLLMENAAAQVVRAIEEDFAPLGEHRIVVLCGKGANGGDGLAIARQLHVQGLAGEVQAAMVADPLQLRGDAAANLRMAQGVGVALTVISDEAGWKGYRAQVMRATLVVDALLGTGLLGAAHGLIGEVIDDLSQHFGHLKFAAVDIPSGMASDAGVLLDPRCPADLTVTFTAPKVGQVISPGCECLGSLRVAPIGTPASLIDGLEGAPLFVLEAGDAATLSAPRRADLHKGSFGHVGIVGGSRSKPGAAIMAGMAAARSGAGLTTVVTAASATSSVVAAAPELMTVPVAESEDGSMDSAALDLSQLDPFSVVVLGPGLGVSEDVVQLCGRLVREATRPMVVDADGLTALSRDGNWSSGSAVLVLTPHPGEMARLLGVTVAAVQGDRIGVARRFATERDAYVVLKGARTVLAAPDGRVLINPTGGPGMATGGSGDILAGLIGGLLAQFAGIDPALVIGGAVYLHGLAGDLAAQDLGEQAMLATDILEFLPQAVRRVRHS
jgi:hydroxyethylthiazole kinase-like uncharacterized protein yjeF